MNTMGCRNVCSDKVKKKYTGRAGKIRQPRLGIQNIVAVRRLSTCSRC